MIRELGLKDTEACAELLMSVYNNELWQCRWTKENAVRYIEEYIHHERFIGYVYEDEGQVVGAILSHAKVWWNQDELFVDEMFVSPDRQRAGIGTLLLQTLEKYCEEKNLAGLTLTTNKYAPAPLFYKKNGFEVAEHVLYMYRV